MIKPLWAGVAGLALLGSAGAVAVYVASSGGEEEVVQQVETLTPSAAPSTTPSPATTASPSATIQATASPESTPSGGQAPDGCVSGELVYEDPAGRFAFCYPADMQLATADTATDDNEGPGVTVQYSPTDLSNNVAVTFGHLTEPYKACSDSLFVVKNQRVDKYLFQGMQVDACFQDHFDPEKPDVLLLKTLEFRVPLKSGKFLQVLAGYSGPDWTREGSSVESIAQRILDSANIN